MPRIPSYQTGQVRQAPIAGVTQQAQYQPEAFGAIQGKAVERIGQQIFSLGGALAQRASQIKQEKDSTAAMSAFVKAGAESTQYLYDPENGVMTKKGQNAIGSYEASGTQFNNIAVKYLDTLENDEQKTAFSKLWSQKQMSMQDSIARHEAAQFQDWVKNTGDAMATQGVNNAILGAGDITAIQQGLDQIKIGVNASLAGQSAEYKNNVINGYNNMMYQGVIERQAATDYRQAQATFDAFEEDMSPQVRENTLKTIETQQLKQETLIKSDEIWFGNNTMAERLSAADSIENGKLRQNVKASLNARLKDQQRIEKEQHDNLVKITTQQIKTAGSIAEAYAIADNLKTDTDIKRFRQLSKFLYGDTSGQPKISNPEKLEEARNLIDRRELTEESQFLYEYSQHLTPSDTKSLRDRLLKGGNTGMLSNSNLKTIYESLTGIPAKENIESFNTTVQYVESNLPPGKDPTDKVLREIMGTALITGENIRFILPSPDRTYAQAVKEGTIDKWLPDVSGQDEKRIETILGNGLIPLTSENIRIARKLEIFSIPITSQNIRIYKDNYGK